MPVCTWNKSATSARQAAAIGAAGGRFSPRQGAARVGIAGSGGTRSREAAVQSIPQRHSLVGQAVTYLNASIAAGQWRDWLPAERTLCEMLQVSRSTLRRALAQLQRDGAIRA